MDLDNPVIKLCVAGTRAEFDQRLDDARRLYQQAWAAATDDYEACIAAHYVARHQATPHDTLRWNQIALERADAANAADADRVGEFYPSLYLNLGRSYELLGDLATAQHYYDRAAELGVIHQAD
jgi:tetratricopeptide (TPR) repeat protein